MKKYITVAFTKKYQVDEIIIKLVNEEIDYTTYYGLLSYITFEFERVEIRKNKDEDEDTVNIFIKGERFRLIRIDYKDIEYMEIE